MTTVQVWRGSPASDGLGWLTVGRPKSRAAAEVFLAKLQRLRPDYLYRLEPTGPDSVTRSPFDLFPHGTI
jgi:hypothetical protein